MSKSWVTLGVLCLFATILTNCGEDEIPMSTIEFDQDQLDGGELSVWESSGSLVSFHPLLSESGVGTEYEIEVALSRPVAETTVIRFSTSGTATRSTATTLGDYDILTDGELLVIEKGESSAIIPLVVYEDYDFEIESWEETFESLTIELEEVVVGSGKLGEFVTFDVYIYEDDTYVELSWIAQDELDANLDAFLWVDGELDYGVDYSTRFGDDYEVITIPAGYPNALHGLSYTYKDGASNDLDIEVIMVNLSGTINGTDTRTYTENYNQTNINDYTTSDMDPFIAQSMTKNAFNFTGLTAIQKSGSGGSRIKTQNITSKINPVSRAINSRLTDLRLSK